MQRAAGARDVKGTIPSLNGIRALAVGLVFFAHNELEDIVPGGLGVTIFFVLSGYLITTLMRTEFAATQRIDFRAFYLRRLLRLMPPLWIVVALAAVLASLSLIESQFTPLGLASVLGYFANYYLSATGFKGVASGIGVVWSLAVEEHYYLLYPPLAALLLRRGGGRAAAAVLGALCVAVLLWRCWLTLHQAPDNYIYMATDTRVDSILVGCMLALARNPWLDHGRSDRPQAGWLVFGAGILLLLLTLLYRDTFFRNTFRYTLQSLAVAPLIYMAVSRAEHPLFNWLNSRPMVYIGTVSYTIYLTHYVALFTVHRCWPNAGWLGTVVVAAALSLAVAEPMRRFVEEPCARLRKRLHEASGRRRTAAGGLAASPPRID